MIYVHTYYTGKFNSVKHIRVYDDFTEAFNQHQVLGGDIKAFELVDDIL